MWLVFLLVGMGDSSFQLPKDEHYIPREERAYHEKKGLPNLSGLVKRVKLLSVSNASSHSNTKNLQTGCICVLLQKPTEERFFSYHSSLPVCLCHKCFWHTHTHLRTPPPTLACMHTHAYVHMYACMYTCNLQAHTCCSVSVFLQICFISFLFLPIGSNCAVLKVLHFYTTEQPELLAVYSGRKAETSLGQDLVLV